MTISFCFVDLGTLTIVAPDSPSLSAVLALGLLPDELLDLTERGYPGLGIWPVVELSAPVFEPSIQRLTDRTYSVDATSRLVVGAHSVVARSIAEIRTGLRDRAAAQRYATETGGITVGGAAVKTDRESQAQLTGAAAALSAGLPAPIDWKASGGWVALDAAAVTALATTVAAHVQACFSREKALCDAIDAAEDMATLVAVDVAAGWPE